jgi:hypothetical protein
MSSPRTARGKPPRTSFKKFHTAQRAGIATGPSTLTAAAKKAVDATQRIDAKGHTRFKSERGTHGGNAPGHQR